MKFPKRQTGKNKQVRPWDIFKKETQYLEKDLASQRYDTCLNCDKFMHATKQCRECGCFMKVKVTMAAASCPLGKW